MRICRLGLEPPGRRLDVAPQVAQLQASRTTAKARAIRRGRRAGAHADIVPEVGPQRLTSEFMTWGSRFRGAAGGARIAGSYFSCSALGIAQKLAFEQRVVGQVQRRISSLRSILALGQQAPTARAG